MTVARAPLNDLSRRGRWDGPLTVKEALMYTFTWIGLYLVTFVVSLVVGFVAVEHPLDYAWKIVAICFVLSLPASAGSYLRNKKLDGYTLEYAGAAALGGLGASALLFFGGLIARIGFGWTPSENLAAALVAGIAFLTGLVFLIREIVVSKRR